MTNDRIIAAADLNQIEVRGAREHNLKNLSLAIPRNKFVVITGVSGSGKSTLAFDLLFAEGQRRFLDAMSTYARQFVEQLSRPDVDLITGIPPTVSMEQRNSRGGGKSTVATVTEIYHFLRLLFARLGVPYCPQCQIPVGVQTRDQLGERLRVELKQRGGLLLLAPVVKNRKGFHTEVAAWAAQHGYAEVRADGKIYDTSQRFRLDRYMEHDVEIVIGRIEAPPGRSSFPQRLIDQALEVGKGALLALDDAQKLTVHSTERACQGCGRSFEPLDPKMLSYNSPRGWCPKCRGFGELFYLPDVERGANAESIEESWFSWQEGEREMCPDCEGFRLNPLARAVRLHVGLASHLNNHQAKPMAKANAKEQFEGGITLDDFAQMDVAAAGSVFRALKWKGRQAEIARDIMPEIRERLRFLSEVGLSYIQLGRGVTTLSSGEAQRIRLAAQLGSNLSGVLYILDEPTIGLHARDNEQLLATLAALRARGNSLVVVEHDEATMRQADHIIDLGPGAGVNGGCLVASGNLRELMRHPESITGQCLRQKRSHPARGERRPVWDPKNRVAGNGAYLCPVLTIEHVSRNNLRDLTVTFPLNRLVLVTGVSGSGKSTLIRESLLPALSEKLRIRGASRDHSSAVQYKISPKNAHFESQMLKGHKTDESIPSPEGEGQGEGDSDFPTLHAPHSPHAPRFSGGGEGRVRAIPTNWLHGDENIRAVYEVDQAPIGRTPRSIPATYVGFFDIIRQVFSQVPEARLRGYSPSRFSFNSAQGRCAACDGAGLVKLEMNFLPPAFVRCETCGGARYNRETLDIEFHGKNIAQVLDLSVAEAIDFFSAFSQIKRPLEALRDTGLDYLKLGQTSPTLSGGEAQRLKLVTHLLSGFKSRTPIAQNLSNQVTDEKRGPKANRISASAAPISRPGNLFLLEEPTIGLHSADVSRLVDVLQRLIDAGHSVIVIEHNLDLIAEADWVIDLGPEGGAAGGRIVASGTPEQIVRNKSSHTGRFLRKLLPLR